MNMARNQNIKRQHFIAPFSATAPRESEYLRLAQYITNIAPNNEEEAESEAYYHGDGTPETTVTSVSKGYDVEGYYDPTDAAQALIAGLELKTLDNRKIWHKVISADGETIFEGIATLTDIVCGGGEASEFEEFSCTIKYDRIPNVSQGSNNED